MESGFGLVILCGIFCLVAPSFAFKLEDSLNHFHCFNTSLCTDGPMHQELVTCELILTKPDEHEKVLYIRDNYFPGDYDDIYGLIDTYCKTDDAQKPEAYHNIVSGAIANAKRKQADPAQKGRYSRLYSMLDCLFNKLCGSSD